MPARCEFVRAAVFLCVLIVAVVGGEPPATAHKTSLSRIDVAVSTDGTVDYRVRVSAHDLAVALGIPTDLVTPVPKAAFETRRDTLDDYVRTRLGVLAQGAPCPPGSVDVDYAGLPNEIAIAVPFHCPGAIRDLTVGYFLFFDIDAAHRSLGTLRLPGGTQEILFDRTVTRLDVTVASAAEAPWYARLGGLVRLGIEHIWAGIDHLLFLFALLVGSVRVWPIVKIVTSFTAAHSLTLGLAWFDVVSPPARPIEVLIALSIAFVAIENILGRGLSHRWMVAGGFGLVHGFGFYGALRDLDIASGAVLTLFGFNLGVEIGQLAVVGALFMPLVWWARQPWYAISARAGSGLILVIAGWWVVERLIAA
ncbi:MAG: HupE/UreJ family protein [Alphaproteobacteria bacterium]|nr:MAG: HupE/UreJ family protein [Alphaproteobacteria bacterium]